MGKRIARRSGPSGNDIGGRQLFGLIVPGVFAIATVSLASAGIWWAAGLAALAAVGAVVWSRRLLADERADEALADHAQRDEEEPDATHEGGHA